MSGLAAHNVKMDFDGFIAVRDATFQVADGEFVTLLGPSGCGKTTLLKIISGFLTPTSGRIEIKGEDVTRVPPEKRDTAMCFQSYALFPHLTVRQNLEFGLRQKNIARDERERRIANVVEQLELSIQLGKLPNQLSGGQQQRVSLGRALVMQPKVILFDEPLSNLDAKLRDQVRIEIKRIQQENKLTAVYVTHDQSEALAMSDRIFVMNRGVIEQAASPEVLYHEPRTAFVADFIGNANVLEVQDSTVNGNRVDLKTIIGDLYTPVAKGSSPQQIAWRPERAKLGADGPIVIKGQVCDRAFQGAFVDLQVATSGLVYRLQLPHADQMPGDEIIFSLQPEDIHVLEAAQ